MFILLLWSFYQGTTSAPSSTEARSAETGGIGENLFSSIVVGFFISPIFIPPTSLFFFVVVNAIF